MLRFRLRELLADRTFQEGRPITLLEVAEATGIHRATLSKIMNQVGANTGTENIDRLCRYFGCQVQDLLTYVPDDPRENGSRRPDAT